jgi:hypothetical protein
VASAGEEVAVLGVVVDRPRHVNGRGAVKTPTSIGTSERGRHTHTVHSPREDDGCDDVADDAQHGEGSLGYAFHPVGKLREDEH